MKYIHNKYAALSFALFSIIFISSCSKELNKNPLSALSSETFWTSEQNTLLALTAVYRGDINMTLDANADPTGWWSYPGLTFLDFATDNAYDRRGDNSIYNKLTNGTLTATVASLGNYWKNSYDVIARANYFLENVDKVSMNADKIKRMKAEVRFIRACNYFYLSQYFQDVPLVTKTLSLQEANTVKKASKAQVVQFVIDELTASSAVVPQNA